MGKNKKAAVESKKSPKPAKKTGPPPPSKSKSSSKKDPKPGTSSGRTGSSTGSGLRRKVKARKASSSKTGNLASELLDMLLSTSNDEFEESESEQDSSDEAWK